MLNEKSKTNRSLHIYDDIFVHSKSNLHIKSLAEWVNNNYPEQFMNSERLQSEIVELEKVLAAKKEEFAAIKTSEKETVFPERMMNWLKNEGLRRVYDRHIPIVGVMKAFNHQFNQQTSKSQFEKILHKLREEKLRRKSL